ncbi:hypothetical protein EPI10_022336 [Gossypium australe]|uniref:Uncharacterized protein n=1 Tax=Gossypium australe TaxID=47621 RepID=A0A5B6WMC4_9ROSI|nr:hypothetical protein EPI10_022336 [Gossypium australe]
MKLGQNGPFQLVEGLLALGFYASIYKPKRQLFLHFAADPIEQQQTKVEEEAYEKVEEEEEKDEAKI